MMVSNGFTENGDMKKVDMMVRIAKTVAITAGICSSDDDVEFDSRDFTDGFTGKIKKKVGEFVDGIHAADAISGQSRVPYIFFPDKYEGEFTDGNYVGKFDISYNLGEDQNGFVFCIGASLVTNTEEQKTLWSDKSCYSIHVKSFSGERAVLNKQLNAFTIGNVGDYSIFTLLKGEAVIDEYGVDEVGEDSEKSKVAEENHEFILDELGKIAEGIKKKITEWIDGNKVISGLCLDMSNEVNQYERNKLNGEGNADE